MTERVHDTAIRWHICLYNIIYVYVMLVVHMYNDKPLLQIVLQLRSIQGPFFRISRERVIGARHTAPNDTVLQKETGGRGGEQECHELTQYACTLLSDGCNNKL